MINNLLKVLAFLLFFCSNAFSGFFDLEILYRAKNLSPQMLVEKINGLDVSQHNWKRDIEVAARLLNAEDCLNVVVIKFTSGTPLKPDSGIREIYQFIRDTLDSKVSNEDSMAVNSCTDQSDFAYSKLAMDQAPKSIEPLSLNERLDLLEKNFTDELLRFIEDLWGEISFSVVMEDELNPIYFAGELPISRDFKNRPSHRFFINGVSEGDDRQIWVWNMKEDWTDIPLNNDNRLILPLYMGIWRNSRHVFALVLDTDYHRRREIYLKIRDFLH